MAEYSHLGQDEVALRLGLLWGATVYIGGIQLGQIRGHRTRGRVLAKRRASKRARPAV